MARWSVRSSLAVAVALGVITTGAGTARADGSANSHAVTVTVECGGTARSFVIPRPGSGLWQDPGSTSIARLVTRSIEDTTTNQQVRYDVFAPGLVDNPSVTLTTCTGRTDPRYPDFLFTFTLLITPQGG